METFNDAIDLWKKTGNENADHLLNRNEVISIIKLRISKQKNRIAQYALASWVWQFIFYVLVVNLIVWAGNNNMILISSLTGIALYIPFTITYAKFCQRMMKNAGERSAPLDSIALDLGNQYQNLKNFFTFKKRFDLIGVPATALLIVLIFEALNYIPGFLMNPFPAIIVFLIYLSAFIAAIYSENRKRFIEPLSKLKAIMEEIEDSKS